MKLAITSDPAGGWAEYPVVGMMVVPMRNEAGATRRVGFNFQIEDGAGFPLDSAASLARVPCGSDGTCGGTDLPVIEEFLGVGCWTEWGPGKTKILGALEILSVWRLNPTTAIVCCVGVVADGLGGNEELRFDNRMLDHWLETIPTSQWPEEIVDRLAMADRNIAELEKNCKYVEKLNKDQALRITQQDSDLREHRDALVAAGLQIGKLVLGNFNIPKMTVTVATGNAKMKVEKVEQPELEILKRKLTDLQASYDRYATELAAKVLTIQNKNEIIKSQMVTIDEKSATITGLQSKVSSLKKIADEGLAQAHADMNKIIDGLKSELAKAQEHLGNKLDTEPAAICTCRDGEPEPCPACKAAANDFKARQPKRRILGPEVAPSGVYIESVATERIIENLKLEIRQWMGAAEAAGFTPFNRISTPADLIELLRTALANSKHFLDLLFEKDIRIDALDMSCRTKTGEINKLSADLKAAQMTLTLADNEAKNLRGTITTREDMIRELSREYRELEGRIAQKIEDATARKNEVIQQHAARILILNAEAGEREDSFRGLQESNKAQRYEIEELKCQIARLTKENRNLSDVPNDVAFARKLLRHLREKNVYIWDVSCKTVSADPQTLLQEFERVINQAMVDHAEAHLKKYLTEKAKIDKMEKFINDVKSTPPAEKPPNAEMPAGTCVTITNGTGNRTNDVTKKKPFQWENGDWVVEMKSGPVWALSSVKPIQFKTEFGTAAPDKDPE